MEPAARSHRLAAAFADGFLTVPPFVLMKIPETPDPVRVLAFFIVLIVLGAQLYFLTMRGQSLGKIILGIRIVDNITLQNGGFVKNVVLRGLVNGLLSMIPLYFLADSLFIFRDDRRCLHDMIAGTRVVKGP